MKKVVGGRWPVIGLYVALCLAGCSVPNLEPADCTQARDVVREFYSFHFANDMHPTEENIRSREKFLEPAFAGKLIEEVKAPPSPKEDFFTSEEDFPKAFRVGECKVSSPGQSVMFDVLLFWKDDQRSEQKHISVGVRKGNGTWRIASVN